MNNIAHNHSTKSVLLMEMFFHTTRRTVLLQHIFLTEDPFIQDELYRKLRDHGSQFLISRQKYLKFPLDKKENKLINQQRQLSLFVSPEQNKAAQLMIAGKELLAKESVVKITATHGKIMKILNELSHHLNQKNHFSQKESVKQQHRSNLISLLLTITVVFILFIISGFVYRNIRQNIQQQKSSYKQIKKSEFRERKIRDLMIDSVIIIDQQGIIKEFNKAAEKCFGYFKDEIIGKNVKLLMTSDDKSNHDQFISNYMESGQANIIGNGREVIAKRKDDTTFFADLSVSKIENRDSINFIGTLHDITDRKENELQLLQIQNDLEHRVKLRTKELASANILLSQQANYDALTGLANRYLFFDRLKQAIAQAKRRDYSLAIFFVDLDGFKNINDTYGHDTGDEVLKKIAIKLQQCLRDEDTVSRIGGDEFAIIINSVLDVKNVKIVTDKIINIINQPLNVTDMNLPVSASIGVSLYPENHTDPDTLLKQADIAMYKSKSMGKNTFNFFKSNDHKTILKVDKI